MKGRIFMVKNFFKNLKIEKKLLLIITSLILISQIFMCAISFISILTMKKYSITDMSNLASNIKYVGESTTKKQFEESLKNLSSSLARGSDILFSEVSDQVRAASEGINKIYEEKEKLTGKILPLPEFKKDLDSSSRNNSFSKAYALDPSSNGDLIYSIPEYQNYYQDNLYFTSPEAWNDIGEEERKEILNNYPVISKNTIPLDLYKEISIFSNLELVCKALYSSNSSISSIYFGTEKGLFYKYSSDSSYERYDHRLRPWYTDALKSNSDSPIWQSTYLSKSTGRWCITCSKVVKTSSGRVLGVCAVDMYLDDISEYVTYSGVGKTGYNFVVDDEGNIVIHPDYSSFASNIEIKESYSKLIQKMLAEKSGVSTAKINSKKYYASYSPLPTNNWRLATLIEENEALEPVNTLHQLTEISANRSDVALRKHFLNVIFQFAVMIIILLILVYFICTKLSSSISKPIVRLSKEAKNIGSGNFSLNISTQSNDEIGELAVSFNTMAKDLKLYTENLARTTAEKEKIHSELMIAKKIQTSMLPYIFPAFPERKDLDIYALMDPAREIGGDFYDFFFVDKNHLALVIADVSGKGISAALFMVIAKILINNQLQNGDSPSQVLRIVNERLCENNEAGMFVTCFIGVMDINTGKLIYSNAGHNPPLLYKRSENSCIPITKPHGFVLGGMKDVKYAQSEVYLYPGDILFLYTDGVTEAENTDGKLFSQGKLEEMILNSASMNLEIRDLVTDLRGKIKEFAGKAERSDDITMLAFKNLTIGSREHSTKGGV